MYFHDAIDCILFIYSTLGCFMLAIILSLILNKMYTKILKMKNDKKIQTRDLDDVKDK